MLAHFPEGQPGIEKGVSVSQEVVQGRMMEQVVSCKDEIAQQYLMQCIIQGFPDEFHLGTLPTLLAALPELQSGVKVHLVLASLLDRLSRSVGPSRSLLLSFWMRILM